MKNEEGLGRAQSPLTAATNTAWPFLIRNACLEAESWARAALTGIRSSEKAKAAENRQERVFMLLTSLGLERKHPHQHQTDLLHLVAIIRWPFLISYELFAVKASL